MPHSEEHGSVEDKIVARVVCEHQPLEDDIIKVFYYLEEAEWVTQHTSSIKPYQRKKMIRMLSYYYFSNIVESISRNKISIGKMSLIITPIRKGKVIILCLNSLANEKTPTSLWNSAWVMQISSYRLRKTRVKQLLDAIL